VAIIIPIYLFYLSLGAGRLQSFKLIASNRVISATVLAAVISVSSLSLLWGFNRQVKPTLYPTDWYQVDTYIRSQDQCQHTTLFLPWHLYMSFNWLGNIVSNPGYAFFSCPTITGTNMEFNGIYDNSQNPQGKQVETWLSSRGTQLQILRNLSIRYVVVAKEVDWQSYDWIQKLSYLHLIKTTSTLLVYEIKP